MSDATPWRRCACGKPAVVMVVGSDRYAVTELREDGGTRFLGIVESVPDRAFCLEHAKEAGWPWWQSEQVRGKRGRTTELHRANDVAAANGD